MRTEALTLDALPDKTLQLIAAFSATRTHSARAGAGVRGGRGWRREVRGTRRGTLFR
jgi:hypothetical protein